MEQEFRQMLGDMFDDTPVEEAEGVALIAATQEAAAKFKAVIDNPDSGNIEWWRSMVAAMDLYERAMTDMFPGKFGIDMAELFGE